MNRHSPPVKQNLKKMVQICHIFQEEPEFDGFRDAILLMQNENTREEDYCRACLFTVTSIDKFMQRNNIIPTDVDAFEQLVAKYAQ